MPEATMTLPKPCPHHWEIETPCGKPTLHGACKLCGEEKDFPAAQAAPWEKEHQKYPLKRHVPPETNVDTTTQVPTVTTRPVKEAKVKKKTKAVEKQWPEILRTLEETHSVNKTARKLDIPYSSILSACTRHEVDVRQYQPMKTGETRASPDKNKDAGSTCQKVQPTGAQGPLVIGLPNLGEALIGLGLMVLGAWLQGLPRKEVHEPQREGQGTPASKG